MKKTIGKFAALAALVLLAGCAGSSGPKEIRVNATGDGFVPDKVTFSKGRPAVLVIKRIAEATCATEAIFVETGRKYDLPLNEEVRIEIPTDQAVTFHYACGMNMYKGEVVVK
jgi:plastocyanin domain-containing protein